MQTILNREELRRIRLGEGDVIVRFRLSATAADEAALDAQLADAARVLRDRQSVYFRDLGIAVKADKRGGVGMHFLRNLRLIDLLDGKNKSDAEPGRALRLLHEKQNAKAPMTTAEALDKYRKQIAQARAMVATGYRALANRDGVASPKAFETADVSHPVFSTKASGRA